MTSHLPLCFYSLLRQSDIDHDITIFPENTKSTNPSYVVVAQHGPCGMNFSNLLVPLSLHTRPYKYQIPKLDLVSRNFMRPIEGLGFGYPDWYYKATLSLTDERRSSRSASA